MTNRVFWWYPCSACFFFNGLIFADTFLSKVLRLYPSLSIRDYIWPGCRFNTKAVLNYPYAYSSKILCWHLFKYRSKRVTAFCFVCMYCPNFFIAHLLTLIPVILYKRLSVLRTNWTSLSEVSKYICINGYRTFTLCDIHSQTLFFYGILPKEPFWQLYTWVFSTGQKRKYEYIAYGW